MDISTMMEACEWGTSRLLVFSENVFAPLIYYSHLTPIVLSLAIGLLILIKDPRSLVNRALFFITALFSLWTLSDLVLWAHESPRYVMFFWSIIVLFEPIIYAACLYFLYAFVTKKAPPLLFHLIAFALLLPTILLASTNYSILGFDLSNCDREVVEGVLVYYNYLVEIIFALWIIGYGIYAVKKYGAAMQKQITLVTTGTFLFLLAFSLGNIAGSFSENWTIGQYGLFGMPIFVAFLAYLIVKFKAFNIKLIATQALVVTLWILTCAILFLRHIESVRIIVSITLFLFIVLGYQLIKSVKREVESRERLQKLTGELQKANTRLKELDTQKTEFISFATHQLRSPLGSIRGSASLILEGDAGEVSKPVREIIQTIEISTKTMVNIVEDYLNVSRIELGTMKYNLVAMDFKDLLHDALNEQKINIEAKGLKYSVTVDESKTYPIKADPDQFKQVVMNLIDNSSKYTPAGSIDISLVRDAAMRVIRLKISDTGVGIQQEVLPKLFQKFSRAPNASAANIHGTGLGLYIAKEIMNAHHGRIWAESEGEGKGSQFYVELPEAR